MKCSQIETPLGPMLAIADDERLHFLDFVERKRAHQATPGRTPLLELIECELKSYFKGELKVFTTPFALRGTPFQTRVWKALDQIPFGETRTYAQIAKSVDCPSGYRAVGQTNGRNCLAIIIPCHRVINSSGALGGYGGGLPRKEWLLAHES